jgi:hypothetical protein
MIRFCFSDDVCFRAMRVVRTKVVGKQKKRVVRGWIVVGPSRVYANIADVGPDMPSETAINLCLARHAGSTRKVK